MDLKIARTIIGNTEISDDDLTVLLIRARKLAANHHFWQPDDSPSEDELDKFYERYEFEIYDIAKAITTSDERNGLKSHTELGVKMEWGLTGKQSVDEAVYAIPPKTYVGLGGHNENL